LFREATAAKESYACGSPPMERIFSLCPGQLLNLNGGPVPPLAEEIAQPGWLRSVVEEDEIKVISATEVGG